MAALLLALSLAIPPQTSCASEVVRVDLDAGVPGPKLTTPSGAPVLNGPFSVRVEEGPPLAPGVLAIGFAEAPTSLPAFAGAVLYPEIPFLALPFALGADGESALLVHVPSLDPIVCGFELVLQAAVLDAAPGGASITNAIRLRAGLAHEAFLPASMHVVEGICRDLLVAHVDTDGRIDLALPFRFPDTGISVLLAAGSGTFELAELVSAGWAPALLRAADLDGDGFQDFVVGNVVSGGISAEIFALRGHGDGTFEPPDSIADTQGAGVVEIGDLDGDGIEDLAVAESNGVAVHPGVGDGTFGHATALPLGSRPGALAVVDLDHDGNLDLAAASPNVGSPTLHVVLGNGDGSFQPGVLVAEVAGRLRAGDLDADGNTDLVAAEKLSVLLGNGDGTFAPPVSHGAGHAMALADVDGDGALDVASSPSSAAYEVQVRLGGGDGTLGPPQTISTGGDVPALEIADVHADGAPDVVAALNPPGSSGALIFPGNGAGGFAAPTPIHPGVIQLWGLTLEDVTEDGKRDLIAATNGTKEAVVIPGDGSGGFGLAVILEAGPGKLVWDVAVADLDVDGVRDLITANRFTADMSVLLGTGGGTFGAPQTFASGIYAMEAQAADFDADGLLDLATASWLQNFISVLRASAPASFHPPITTFTGSVAPVSLSVADIDLDGVLDCALANWWSNTTTVLLGQGDGTFETPLVAALGDQPMSLALDDFNADGAPDAAVADTQLRQLFVLLGNGDGTFTPGPILPTADYPHVVAIRDLDGDSRPDIMAAGLDFAVNVFRGLGGGSFAAAETHVVGGSPIGLATGDLDGDGLHDVAVGLTSGPAAAILINRVGEQP